jgi:hypothetical protein
MRRKLVKDEIVLGLKSKKPRERFYLLPGQGGKNYYRKQRFIMRWTVAVSLVFAISMGMVMWWLARRP